MSSCPVIPILPGKAAPLGATLDGSGANFSLYSEVAERVELCLFDASGVEQRVDLPSCTAHHWCGYVPGVSAGQRYGFRVHGPYQPAAGHRCNANKLLIDPYARALEGRLRWDHSLFGHQPEGDGPSDGDSAPFVPKCLVVDDRFDWQGDAQLQRPWSDTVIYETHVRNFTALRPEIPEALRGTYSGVAHPRSIAYLKELGATAVELMPVFQFEDEFFLHQRGMHNHWGYNPVSFFAPHNGFASASGSAVAVREFKQMVKTLHQAGLEVILDVVYNHTAEGDLNGPTLTFRGIDNAAYYRHRHDALGQYQDFTGCGNTVNIPHPHVLSLVMDSLRYWVNEMHVDGFRFDLACTLGRGRHGFESHGAFLSAVRQDPVLSRVKMIAEPWDLGEGGYQVGNFPWPWREWNGKYRDYFRDFWRGQAGFSGEFARRFAGSHDLYPPRSRSTSSGINFITSHDGFTLRDLVSFNHKHNDANGEHNRDGESHNRSWNCGAEGPTEDSAVIGLRARQQRNLLATLLLSRGVPMLLSGDEFGRTQGGNNNAYCQDNAISWLDWQHTDQSLLRFVTELIALRASEPLFCGDVGALRWFTPEGIELSEHSDGQHAGQAVALLLESGEPNVVAGSTHSAGGSKGYLVLFNPGQHAARFEFPVLTQDPWQVLVDTSDLEVHSAAEHDVLGAVELRPHSLKVLRRVLVRVGVIRSLLPA